MTRRFLLFATAFVLPAFARASEPPRTVVITGKIEKVQIAPRQGMPSLLLQTANGPIRLFLGPMRYLVEQDFRPTAGETVEAEVLRNGEEAVALTITLKSSKTTLKIRDAEGRPLWRGHHGPRRHR